MVRDSVKHLRHTMKSGGPGRDLIDKYLQANWRLLDNQYQLQKPPGNSPVRPAWEVLEEHFPRSGRTRPLGPALTQLLDRPYGLDFFPLATLFCAWYGLHRHELSLVDSGKVKEIDEFLEEDKPDGFLRHLALEQVQLRRHDPDAERRELDHLARRVLETDEAFSAAEAEAALGRLTNFLQKCDPASVIHKKCSEARDILASEMREEKKYKQRAREIMQLVRSPQRTLESLCYAYANLGLPELNRVTTHEPSAKELMRELSRAISQQLDQLQEQVHRAKSGEAIGKCEIELERAKKVVEKTGNQDFQARLHKLDQALARRREEDRARAADRELLGELRAMEVTKSTGLAELERRVARLAEMRPASEEARELREQRRRELEERRAALEKELERWQEGLEEAGDGTELRKLRQEVQERRLLFAGSPAEERVNSLAEALAGALAEVEQLERIGVPKDPRQAEEVRGVLLAAVDGNRCEAVRQTAREKLRRVEEHCRSEEQRAARWLEAREAQAHRGENVVSLQRELEAAPAFLASHLRPRWEALRAEVAARLEQDALERAKVAVRELRDRAKLEELLAAVEARLRELGG